MHEIKRATHRVYSAGGEVSPEDVRGTGGGRARAVLADVTLGVDCPPTQRVDWLQLYQNHGENSDLSVLQ